MFSIKPIELNSEKIRANTIDSYSAAEIGKLWTTYMGNSMSVRILSYFYKNTEDEEIKLVVENALTLSVQIVKEIEVLLKSKSYPIPIGFSEEDVNLSAPRLFSDELYLHYLKYAGKAGLDLYGAAIPMMIEHDVCKFFSELMSATVKLLQQVNEVLLVKGFLAKIPNLPISKEVTFVKKKSYLNAVIGDVRPLNALEVAHLHYNLENNLAGKALLIGFSQTARNNSVKDFFLRGKEITAIQIEDCARLLHKDNLPSPPLLDHLVTTSTVAPFSDKLMLFHKIDMFAMKIRSFGDAVSVSGRHDLGAKYTKFLMEIALYVNDGAKILIENGWMEKMPGAADREELSSN
jgi:hypothetical protein